MAIQTESNVNKKDKSPEEIIREQLANSLTDKKDEQTRTTIRKAYMLSALEANLGVVSTACKMVGINRETHYAWIKQDPAYKLAVEDLADVALDFVEALLFNQIKNMDTAATIFYLKTKGKKRGYIERTEFDIRPDPFLELMQQFSNQDESKSAEIKQIGE